MLYRESCGYWTVLSYENGLEHKLHGLTLDCHALHSSSLACTNVEIVTDLLQPEFLESIRTVPAPRMRLQVTDSLGVVHTGRLL